MNEAITVREVRNQFRLDGNAEAQMIVTGHHSPQSAERWRKGWSTRAFEHLGEWYEEPAEGIALPNHLAEMPGSLVHFDYRFGEAGEHKTMLVGAFRRDHIACVIRVDGEVDALIALAEFFAVPELPEPFALAWSAAHLQRFLPSTDSIGMSVEESDYFWP